MQRISQKSRHRLYDTVSNEVMDARIKIEKFNIDPFFKEQLDKIMFELQCSVSQKAIDCFITEKDR